MSMKTPKAERTRKFIITQTAPVFNRKGFAGTSMSDLMLATGLSKGAIYGRFKNKDQIALEAFDFNMKQITSVIGEMMTGLTSPVDKLWVFPKFYREVFKRKHMKLGCPIVNSAPEADDTHQAIRKHVNLAIKYWDQTIREIIKDAILEKEIRSEIDPGKIAAAMITQIEGGILITKSTGDMRYMNTALDQVEKMIDEIVI